MLQRSLKSVVHDFPSSNGHVTGDHRGILVHFRPWHVLHRYLRPGLTTGGHCLQPNGSVGAVGPRAGRAETPNSQLGKFPDAAGCIFQPGFFFPFVWCLFGDFHKDGIRWVLQKWIFVTQGWKRFCLSPALLRDLAVIGFKEC